MDNKMKTEKELKEKKDLFIKKLKEVCKIDWDKGNFVLANVNERIDKLDKEVFSDE